MAYLRSCPNIFRNSFKHLQSSRSFSEVVQPVSETLSSTSPPQKESPGLGDAMMDFICGNKGSAQTLTRSVWSHFVNKGDVVIDATCGNGNDTLALLRMVADSTRKGRVYAFDILPLSLKKASELLDQHVTPKEKELVQMFAMCHSELDYVVPASVLVRLVAFNLGSCHRDKLRKRLETTPLALRAATRILAPGGLISVILPMGHSGGREVFEKVQTFASQLPVKDWSCCKLEMFGRPSAVLFLLVKR